MGYVLGFDSSNLHAYCTVLREIFTSHWFYTYIFIDINTYGAFYKVITLRFSLQFKRNRRTHINDSSHNSARLLTTPYFWWQKTYVTKPHFTNMLVVMSHESNAFSMSVFFAFRWSHGCGMGTHASQVAWKSHLQHKHCFHVACITTTTRVAVE